MKKLFFLSVAVLLLGLTIKAQIRTDEFDFLKKDISDKETRTAIIENQRHLKLQPLLQSYLRDSSLYYEWDSVNNVWSGTPYQLAKMEYNYQGFITWVRFFAWQATTSSWVNAIEFNYVRDIYGNITEWIYNQFNTNTNTWIPYEHDSMTYANNILISESWNYYNEDNNTWIKGASWKYNYNGALLESVYLYLNYLTYEVEGGSKEIYTLNQRDMPIERIDQDLNSLSQWVNYKKTESSYQNDTVLLNEIIYAWNTSYATWDIYGQSLYYYSANLNSEVINQVWISSAWANYSRQANEYNSTKLVTKKLYQDWNGSDWVNSTQSLYTYNANNLLTENLNQYLINNIWVNYNLYGYTFDNNGNQTERLYKRWDMQTGLLTSSSYKSLFTFNSDTLNTEIVYQKWNTNIADWLNNYKVDNYFSKHEVNGLTEPGTSSVSIYPNPVSNTLFLNGLSGNEKISISDMTGKWLLIRRNTNNQIDVSSFQNGAYTIRIENSKGIITRKFVKQ
jgi:hypothetical protein